MKKLYLLFVIGLLSNQNLFAQILLENKDGDPLFLPLISSSQSGTIKTSNLVKINTGDQSLGFTYFKTISPSINNPKNRFFTFGAKAKPTEGYASVLRNGQFSPGINFSGAITQIKIFDKLDIKPENGFLDWGSIYFNYNTNKYQLYKSDTVFSSQVYSVNFRGFDLGLNYSALLKSRSLISIKVGYSRKSNFEDLSTIEVKDTKSVFDSASNTLRQVVTSKSAKKGEYSEYDTYPFTLSYTNLNPSKTDNNSLSLGYSIYLNGITRNEYKPITNAGLILYLTKYKDEVSIPVLGFNFQFNDFFDVNRSNTGLLNRLSVGITTNFSFF